MAGDPTPEDIFSSSLQSLYSHGPLSFSDKIFTHSASGLRFALPDTSPSNWVLHASSIWVASLFLASHLDDISMTLLPQNGPLTVLELGAGSGLPGIQLAKRSAGKALVTLSDYPDDAILHCLEDNVRMNNIDPSSVKIVGHVWGQCTAALGTFDIVLAADTLWNSELHIPFCQTLARVLRQSEDARIYLVAGLHTGRWTIHQFLQKLSHFGLAIDILIERQVDVTFDSEQASLHSMNRTWEVEREGEEESERRNWVVWIVIKWAESTSSMKTT